MIASNVHLASLAAALCAACAAGSPVGDTCSVGSDCESGACKDGRCVDPDAPTGGSGGGPSSTATGSGGGPTSSAVGTGGGATCSPDHDGVITRSEVPIAAGLTATFRAAIDVTVSTAGTTLGDKRVWDFSAALPGDHATLLETMPVSGAWFEPAFPGATYAARLSEEADLLGVFAAGEASLSLRGVVSPQGGFDRTELSYDVPATVLAFPLEVGGAWSTDSTVSGLAAGFASTYVEQYDSVVDARGDVVTPFATFDALRVRVELTRWVGTVPTTTRTYVFVTECFGTIATVVSQPNETVTEFVDAAEIRRLAP